MDLFIHLVDLFVHFLCILVDLLVDLSLSGGFFRTQRTPLATALPYFMWRNIQCFDQCILELQYQNRMCIGFRLQMSMSYLKQGEIEPNLHAYNNGLILANFS